MSAISVCEKSGLKVALQGNNETARVAVSVAKHTIVS